MFMLVMLAFLLGNGIVSCTAKRIAAKDAPYRKSKSDEKATFFKCLEGIG